MRKTAGAESPVAHREPADGQQDHQLMKGRNARSLLFFLSDQLDKRILC